MQAVSSPVIGACLDRHDVPRILQVSVFLVGCCGYHQVMKAVGKILMMMMIISIIIIINNDDDDDFDGDANKTSE